MKVEFEKLGYYLDKIDVEYGIKIDCHSFSNEEGDYYFNVDNSNSIFREPFRIEINYNSIKNKECFVANIPSLILKEEDLERLSKQIIKIDEIIRPLNNFLKCNY